MRYGFTTGSCAAAAAKAATDMLLLGGEKEQVDIMTPKGIIYHAKIEDIQKEESRVSCAVRKDGGDDPDVTTGMMIYATVSFGENSEGGLKIEITGGKGIGTVTKPGLDQLVGKAAINRVPREMICREVREVCKLADYDGKICICIWSPTGEEVAKKTFNPRLGICGGISIIGTSGIVEPMSQEALLKTIHLELKQRKEQGFSYVAVSPGNYGVAFMKKQYQYDLDKSVKCSNFIGKTIDMAVELKYESMILIGHIGKMIKLAGGMMNTHSAEGDCRMELLAASAVYEGVSAESAKKVLNCLTTEEALEILKKDGMLEAVMRQVMKKVMFYLERRAGGKIKIHCMIYANGYGVLAKSEGAEEWLTLLVQEQEQLI